MSCKYYSNPLQIRGVEEYTLTEGAGRGMRLMRLRNGRGIDLTISPDRCSDIVQLFFKGENIGFMGPVGMVAPSYCSPYDFSHTFTAGFMTTCGLDNVGEYWEKDGTVYPQHGYINKMPATHCYWSETGTEFIVTSVINQMVIGGDKLVLKREIRLSKDENIIRIDDCVENQGSMQAGVMLMYHINVGYPLLSENAILEIDSDHVRGLDDKACRNIGTWQEIWPPNDNNPNVCYFHEFKKKGMAKLYNPSIQKGIEIEFDIKTLPCLNQWKKLHEYDYVMGLEPGNTYPVGRRKAEEEGTIKKLKPGESEKYYIKIQLLEGK